MDDLYLSLFFDSIYYGTLLVGRNDGIFYAMKEFGGYDMRLAVLICTVGTTLGTLTNVVVGKGILRVVEHLYGKIEGRAHEVAQAVFSKYAVYLLLFTFHGMFNALAVLAGFFKCRMVQVVALIFIGRAAFYCYQAFVAA